MAHEFSSLLRGRARVGLKIDNVAILALLVLYDGAAIVMTRTQNLLL